MNKPTFQGGPRRVLITGANKGIGLATVSAILSSYEDVTVLLGARDADRGHAAIASLCTLHPDAKTRVEFLPIDVCDPVSVDSAAQSVLAKYPDDPTPVYAVVNNAGSGFGSDDLGSAVDVNLLGVKRVCDAFLPLIPKHGRMVNVSSASGPKFVSQC